MTNILNYGRERKELIELATIDESADWAVDYAEIFYDPDKKELVLLTASGCSCWEGEYQEERAKTWKALKEALLKGDTDYNPTIKGAEIVFKEAKEKFKELKLGKK
jgi:hypothetical protein